MTNTIISLETHIAKLNADIQANGGVGHVETSLQYWAEMGITTTEEFIHNELVTEHFELYKDIHGIKPRWFKYSEMTIEQLKFDIADLLNYEEKMKQHRIDEKLHEKKRVQAIKAKNAYKPNNPFANLKEMIG